MGIAREVYLYSGGEGSLGQQLSISGRGAIRHLIFSPDSRWLAVGTDGGTVQVWEQVGMRFHLRWQGEVSESAIVGLTFDPEGLRLAIASSGGALEIRRLPEGTQEGHWEGYLEPVLDLAFGKDQLWIATYSQRPIDTPQWIVSLWRVTGHGVQRVQRLTLSAEPMAALSLSPDGRWALAPDPHPAGAAGWGIWRTADGTRMLWIPGGGSGAAFSPDGELLALSDSEGGFRLIRRADGQMIRHLGWLSEKPPALVTFSPDGTWVAASDGREIGIWHVSTGARWPPVRPTTGMAIEALALSDGGEWLAVAERGLPGAWIALYATATGQPVARWPAGSEAVLRLTFGPGNTWLASGTGDGMIRIWRMPDGALLQSLNGHTDAIVTLKLSPDGQTLASGSIDGTVRLWSLR